jgi:hypothetical protein
MVTPVSREFGCVWFCLLGMFAKVNAKANVFKFHRTTLKLMCNGITVVKTKEI